MGCVYRGVMAPGGERTVRRGGLTLASVLLRTRVPDGLPVPSLTGIFRGAAWHERETHEMFGIHFAGHPWLANLYLPLQFEGFPLRKDFPLLSRRVKPWPGIVDVEPMPAVEGAEPEAEAEPEVPS